MYKPDWVKRKHHKTYCPSCKTHFRSLEEKDELECPFCGGELEKEVNDERQTRTVMG